MRTHAPAAALLLSLLLVGLPLAAAQAPSDGSTTTITGSETWTDDGHMDGHVVIAAGGSLTVNANMTVATGSSFTVEDGGQLVLTNGALLSDDLNAGLMVNSVYATITLNFGDLADEGVVQLKFDHAINAGSKFNVTLGDETVSASGEELIQFDAPLNGTDLVVSFRLVLLHADLRPVGQGHLRRWQHRNRPGSGHECLGRPAVLVPIRI